MMNIRSRRLSSLLSFCYGFTTPLPF